MPPRRRPTAFDVSFPEEAQLNDSASGTSDTNRKRDRDGVEPNVRVSAYILLSSC
ncbi:hypothetical protein HYDPIDRAFT_120602 [Hydnomerulius pinastri MD-312]|uniref:Uncharacterized protein n=1 Tax=Hydnomerulius pinastri MD-312 TaxID=994086 RepID=A0A0C2KJ91_9AGAM|nr:hypothetical protein HYDPIDRAFT_120602 [Hydnomerulius pinastri MD-312]